MRRVHWTVVSTMYLAMAVVARGSKPCSCVGRTMECSRSGKTAVPPSEVCGLATRVRLGGNKLRSLPDGLRAHAVDVDVSANRLSALPDASQLHPRTKILDVSGNGIAHSKDELRNFSSLQVLDIRGNRLTSLSFLPLSCVLRRLEASWNEISSLIGPLYQCTYMTSLNLGHNKLVSLPAVVFGRMNRLKVLDLSDNQLTSLPRNIFATLGRLKDLRLDRNRLLHLPDGLFDGLRSIRKLALQNNLLEDLPVIGACCARLEAVSFASNCITEPSKAALRPLLGDGRRRSVDLTGNPVRAEALGWVLRVAEVRTFLGSDCACGGLRRGRARVQLCVATQCGRGARFHDWVFAVRQAARGFNPVFVG